MVVVMVAGMEEAAVVRAVAMAGEEKAAGMVEAVTVAVTEEVETAEATVLGAAMAEAMEAVVRAVVTARRR